MITGNMCSNKSCNHGYVHLTDGTLITECKYNMEVAATDKKESDNE